MAKDTFQFPTVVFDAQETSRTVGVHYGQGYQVGMRLTENFSDFWSADLEYNFANQPLHFTNLSPTIQDLALTHSIHHISYSISYIPLSRRSRFRPYAQIGAGGTLFFIDGDSKDKAARFGLDLQDTWKFTVDWGGGLKYLVNDQVALAFDAKDQMTGLPSYGLPRYAQVVNGQYQPGFGRSGLLHNVQFNFGVVFQWDEW
jgi:opacity protein-like surface antigen